MKIKTLLFCAFAVLLMFGCKEHPANYFRFIHLDGNYDIVGRYSIDNHYK